MQQLGGSLSHVSSHQPPCHLVTYISLQQYTTFPTSLPVLYPSTDRGLALTCTPGTVPCSEHPLWLTHCSASPGCTPVSCLGEQCIPSLAIPPMLSVMVVSEGKCLAGHGRPICHVVYRYVQRNA